MTARTMYAYFQGALIIEVRLFMDVYSINLSNVFMIRVSHNRAVPVIVPEHTKISINLPDFSGGHK